MVDQRVAGVTDLFQARDYAKALARSLFETADLEDWRSYRLHVRDEKEKEIFVMPLSWVLGNGRPLGYSETLVAKLLYRSGKGVILFNSY